MESVLRGVTVYILLLIVTRLSGRRSLAQVTPFDFVLLLIVAETTQQALLGDDFSITNAAVLILTLFFSDIILSYLKQWSPRTEALLDGHPTVLVSRGRPDNEALRRSRISLEDVLEAARQQGLSSLAEVEHVVLEIGGELSVIPKKAPSDSG